MYLRSICISICAAGSQSSAVGDDIKLYMFLIAIVLVTNLRNEIVLIRCETSGWVRNYTGNQSHPWLFSCHLLTAMFCISCKGLIQKDCDGQEDEEEDDDDSDELNSADTSGTRLQRAERPRGGNGALPDTLQTNQLLHYERFKAYQDYMLGMTNAHYFSMPWWPLPQMYTKPAKNLEFHQMYFYALILYRSLIIWICVPDLCNQVTVNHQRSRPSYQTIWKRLWTRVTGRPYGPLMSLIFWWRWVSCVGHVGLSSVHIILA